MGSPLKNRDEAIFPAIGATDLTSKQGYLVTLSATANQRPTLTATLSASATAPATGVILDGGTASQTSSIGILGALSGSVRMKTSGVIAQGARVQQAADGTIVTDAGAGNARVVVGIALEAAVSGDLIEVAPLAPMILP